MPELIDIDPIVICPNSLKCTKRKATVKSPNMIRVQPIVRCPGKLKCPPSYRPRSPRSCRGRSCSKSRGHGPSSKSRGYSPSYKPRGHSPKLYKRGISPIFKGMYSPTMYNRGRSPSLCHGGIIIIPRN